MGLNVKKNLTKLCGYKITVEILIIISLVIASYFVGLRYMQNFHGKQEFYQDAFAPAVMLACDRGFVAVDKKKSPAVLADFLQTKTKALSCSELPKKLAIIPFSRYQNTEYYLLLSAGLLWKYTGVSWPNLYPLNAVLFALTILGIYALLRLGSGIIIALLVSTLFFKLSFYYGMLPQLRDYSIAPFIVLYLFVLGSLVKFPYKSWRTIGLACLAGVIFGIGFGFRIDLLLFAPFFILLLLFFTETRITDKLFSKSIASVIYLIIIAVLGYPIFKMLGHNDLFHNALQGFSTSHTYNLGIIPAPLYGYHYKYTDYFIHYIVISYFNHVLHMSVPLHGGTPLYAKVSSQYFWHFVLTFPADMVIRVLASIYNILSFPYVKLANHLFVSLMAVSIMKYFAAIAAISAIIIICKISFRIALIVLFFLFFLGAYPVVQYEYRHMFYLAFVPFWIAAFLLQCGYNVIFSPKGTYSVTQTEWRRIIIFVATFGGLLLIVLGGAIGYQNYSLTKLFNKYEHAKVQRLPVLNKIKNNNYTFIKLPNFTTGSKAQGVGYGILAVTFNQRLCNRNPLYMRVKYDTWPPADKYYGLYEYNLMTHTVRLKASKITKVFIPIYLNAGGKFIGIDIPNDESKCFVRAEKIVDTSQFPIEVIVKLPSNWRQLTKHQSIGSRASFELQLPKTFYVLPSNLKLPKTVWQQKLQTMKLHFNTKIFQQRENKYFIDGKPKSRFDYIALFTPINITSAELAKANYYLVAQGKLYQGGFTIGFLLDKRWLANSMLNIKYHHGRDFYIAIKITKPGKYTPVIANNLDRLGRNNFVIDKIGWLKENEKNHNATS